MINIASDCFIHMRNEEIIGKKYTYLGKKNIPSLNIPFWYILKHFS